MLDETNLNIPNESYSVYCLYFPNGKMYVGITNKDPQRRWRNGNGYKSQPVIFHAINKYGWENITKEVLLNGLTEAEAVAIEIDLIHRYHLTNHNYGYNVSLGGDLGTTQNETVMNMIMDLWNEGYSITEIRRISLRGLHTISVALRTLGVTDEEIHARSRAKAAQGLCAYWAESHNKIRDRIIALWNEGYTVKEIVEQTGIYVANVYQALRDCGINMDVLNECVMDRGIADSKKTIGCAPRPVCQYDLDGNYIATFSSLSEAEKQTGAMANAISSICSGSLFRKSAGGYMWAYESDHIEKLKPLKHNYGKPVSQYTKDGSYITTYPSVAEASRVLGKSNSKNITSAASGRSKTAYGFIWKYQNTA